MDKQYILTFLSISILFILVIGNIRYLHSLAKTISKGFKETATLIIKVCLTAHLAESNAEKIKKIDQDLTLKNKRLRDYIIEVHNQILINTGRIRIMMKADKFAHFECDAKGRCTWVNEAAAELFGVDREDMLGNGWAASILEEERNQVVKHWQESVKYDVPYTYKYKIFQKKRNKVIELKVTSVTIRDSDGNPIMFCGNISEV